MVTGNSSRHGGGVWDLMQSSREHPLLSSAPSLSTSPTQNSDFPFFLCQEELSEPVHKKGEIKLQFEQLVFVNSLRSSLGIKRERNKMVSPEF